MPMLTTNGATIAYTDTGAPAAVPDAPTIVFGHGLLFSGWMFSAQIAALQDNYRCVAIDWRGQGDSPVAAGGYDMDTLTADVRGLIEHLAVGPVHYVGLSMGGFVGLRLAARHPELVRSLVLLDTSADAEDPSAARQDKLLSVIFRLFGIGPVRKPVLKLMFGPSFRLDPRSPQLIDDWLARLARCDRGAIRHAVLGVVDRNSVLAELGAIAAPTLVAVGEHDVPTPVARARAIVATIAGSRLEIIPDSGHSSSIEQPEKVTTLIRDFLEVG
ncbi:MAG: alpha/beta hydrolase [Jatrophihabitantaceae bacterium]